MRIGATLLLKNGFCYQSYGWNLLRPFGSLQNAVDHLEEYCIDEIAIIRLCRNNDNKTSLMADLKLIKDLDCMTPIAFGGGLRDIQTIELVKNLPIERLIFSSSFIEKNQKLLDYAVNIFGKQAIISLLPIYLDDLKIKCFCPSLSKDLEIDMEFIDSLSNEVIIYDIKNEGNLDGFEMKILEQIKIPTSKIIATGGIGDLKSRQLYELGIAATYIDNTTLHREYSTSYFKVG